LKNNGLNDILICIGYLGEEVKKYFGNGEKWGLNIEYSFEREPLDTGGAIKNAEDRLENEFLALYGDTFLDINYKDLISYSRKKAKLGTIVVFKNKPKIFKNNIEINDKKEVIAYNKTEEDKANCVDAGVEIFKKNILKLIPSNKVVSLEKDIYPILIEKRELIAYLTNHRFYDIGTFEQLKKINQIL